MTVLAHLSGGHWYEILIYLAPLLIVGGWILWEVWRDRRRQPSEDEAAEQGVAERAPDNARTPVGTEESR